MIKTKVKLVTNVPGKLKRLPRKLRPDFADAVNLQMDVSRFGTGTDQDLPVVGMALRIALGWGLTPAERVTRRMFTPRGAWATPRKLWADGLMLFDTLPMRYFNNRIPAGAVAVETGEDTSGRSPFGGSFNVALKSGATGRMRKFRPQTWTKKRAREPQPRKSATAQLRFGPERSYLPIGWAFFIDASDPAERIRAVVLKKLGIKWQLQIDKLLKKRLPRAFNSA